MLMEPASFCQEIRDSNSPNMPKTYFPTSSSWGVNHLQLLQVPTIQVGTMYQPCSASHSRGLMTSHWAMGPQLAAAPERETSHMEDSGA